MSDKMREALHNLLVSARPYASDDGIWPIVIRNAEEALAEQPAQDKPVGLLQLIRDARHRICDDAPQAVNGQSLPPFQHPVYGPLLRRLDAMDALLAASPAPSVPDDVAKDAARYRWLRDQDYDDGCVILMKEKYIPRFVSYSTAIDNYIDAAMLAAAPR